jgi:hypothetical protein
LPLCNLSGASTISTAGEDLEAELSKAGP